MPLTAHDTTAGAPVCHECGLQITSPRVTWIRRPVATLDGIEYRLVPVHAACSAPKAAPSAGPAIVTASSLMRWPTRGY